MTRNLWGPKPKDSQVQAWARPHRPSVWPSGFLGPVPSPPHPTAQDKTNPMSSSGTRHLWGDRCPGQGSSRPLWVTPPSPQLHHFTSTCVSQRVCVCVGGGDGPRGAGLGLEQGEGGALPPSLPLPSASLGMFCSSEGLSQPSGLCHPAHYCTGGAVSATPVKHKVSGVRAHPAATTCDGATELAGVLLGPGVLTPGLKPPEGRRTLPASHPQGQGPVTAYFCYSKMCAFPRLRSLKSAAAHKPQNPAVVMAVIFFPLKSFAFE